MVNAADSDASTYPSDPMDRLSINFGEQVVTGPLPGGGAARYWLEVDGSDIRVAKVEVVHPGRGVSGRDLRNASPSEALDAFKDELIWSFTDPVAIEARRYAERLVRAGARAVGDDGEAALHALREPWKGWEPALSKLTSGVRVDGIDERTARLAVTAAAYVAARRESPRPNEQVGALLRSSARKVTEDLRAARNAGLLTKPPGRGVPGGELTQRARALLERLVS